MTRRNWALSGLGTLLILGLCGASLAATPSTTVDDAAVLAAAAREKPHAVPRVPWLIDVSWAEVRDRAQTADQPILLDFTATWCGPCKLLDVMVFTEKPVIAQLSDVIPFQVDIDKPEYKHLRESFAIESVPTLVWCDKGGREIDRFTGYVSSVEFLGIVAGWQDNRTIDRVLAEQQSSAPQNPAVLLAVARRQAERGKDYLAEVLYRRLINLRFEAEVSTVARGMLGLAGIEHRLGRDVEARRLARRVAALYQDGGVKAVDANERQAGMLEAALFQESIADTLGMLDTFRTLAEVDRRNVLALHGYARAAVRTGEDLPAATKSALRAVVYSDNDPDVISTLAECYYWRGLYRKAIRWQKKAVTAAPHQAIYREQLRRYEAAQADDPHHLRGAPVRTY